MKLTRQVITAGTLIFAVVLSAGDTCASSIHPQIRDKLVREGRLKSYRSRMAVARAAGMNAPAPNAPERRFAAGAQTIYKIPVIMVDFTDNPASGDNANTTAADVDSLLFSTGGVNPTGSMRDYYLEVSHGAIDIQGVIAGNQWLRMSNTYAHYIGTHSGVGSPPNARDLVADAIALADPFIDFSQFDNDFDGVVDGVMVIVAGFGFEDTGDTTRIQSHMWSTVSTLNLDGINLKRYTIQPEESALASRINGIGVFCHEWGHILNLPDLYDTDGSSEGLGNWSIMASGNWLNSSQTPCHFDAWCKERLGFVTPRIVASNMVNVPIASVVDSAVSYRLWTGGTGGNEYFLVENRQKTGFDAFLPGHGLVVYHVDTLKGDNNNEWRPGDFAALHYKVAMEQADGRYDLERGFFSGGNLGDDRDSYTASTREFDDLTAPSSRHYDETTPTEVAVWNISASGPVMTANLDVNWSRPYLTTFGFWFDDAAGNNDGVPDPGETVNLLFNTTNLWATTSDVEVTVSMESVAGITITDDHSALGSLATGENKQNLGDPITIAVSAALRPRVAELTVTTTSESGAHSFEKTLSVAFGPPQVLLVDDDSGSQLFRTHRERRYVDILDTLFHEVFDIWDTDAQGSPSAGDLLPYPIVIWFTGDYWPTGTPLTHNDVVALSDYMDTGRSTFITGQDIAQTLASTQDSVFLRDYFGVTYNGTGNPANFMVTGVPGDPIGDSLDLIFSLDGAGNQNSPDYLAAVSGGPIALPSFEYTNGQSAAVRVAGSHRSAFWAFGFEGAASNQNGFATRETVMTRVMSHMINLTTGILDDPTDNGSLGTAVPVAHTLDQNYPNPFNARTVIGFTITGRRPQAVTVDVINILGRHVVRLVDGAVLEPGEHQIAWDGRTAAGREAASGVYFYRVAIGDSFAEARRMVLLK